MGLAIVAALLLASVQLTAALVALAGFVILRNTNHRLVALCERLTEKLLVLSGDPGALKAHLAQLHADAAAAAEPDQPRRPVHRMPMAQ